MQKQKNAADQITELENTPAEHLKNDSMLDTFLSQTSFSKINVADTFLYVASSHLVFCVSLVSILSWWFRSGSGSDHSVRSWFGSFVQRFQDVQKLNHSVVSERDATCIVDNNGCTVVTVPFAPSFSCRTRSFSVVRLALLGRNKAPNTFVNLSHYLIISSHYLSWTSIQLGIPPQIVRMVRSGVNWPDNPAASPRITSHSGRRFAGIH